MEKADRGISIGRDNLGYANTGDISDSIVNVQHSASSKTDNISSITVDKDVLNQMPLEYKTSLEEMVAKVNEQLQKVKIASEKIVELQQSVNDLAKDTAGIETSEISYQKRNSIGGRLVGIAKSLVKISPKLTETITSFTPLAPFSKLIGEGFEKIVNEQVANERK